INKYGFLNSGVASSNRATYILNVYFNMSSKRNKFRLTRFILLKLSYIFRFLSKFRKPAKRLLIIKIDAIGDYILFRNYLEILHQSERFKDYEIELLGNDAWKDLTWQYDSNLISKYWFINE